jgi:hypothetical protein
MNWKRFLKPDWRKIILTVILISLSFLYIYEPVIMDAYEAYRGLPMFYWKYFTGTGLIVPGMNLPEPVTEFLYLNLIIDLIFWYFLSCLIIWIYNKVKKK